MLDIVNEAISAWYNSATNGSWSWFNSLTRQEWIVVLAIGAGCGFLCVKGMGIKK